MLKKCINSIDKIRKNEFLLHIYHNRHLGIEQSE